MGSMGGAELPTGLEFEGLSFHLLIDCWRGVFGSRGAYANGRAGLVWIAAPETGALRKGCVSGLYIAGGIPKGWLNSCVKSEMKSHLKRAGIYSLLVLVGFWLGFRLMCEFWPVPI